MLKSTFLIAIFLLIGSWSDLSAQDFSKHRWYFGTSGKGIHFSKNNKGKPVLVNSAVLNTGGSAVATDPVTGTVLFYTDGRSVYDITGNPMPAGNNILTANQSGNQPVAVCRKPGNGNATQYYLFTNTADGATAGTISVTTIDMSQSGGATFPQPPRGNVIPPFNQATGITSASEAMIIVPNAAQNGFWLITHQNGGTDYIVLGISNTGAITAPTTYPGVSNITQATHIGYFDNRSNASPAIHRIATTSQVNGQEVEILDFDPATGVLTNRVGIAGSGNAGPVYDVEWGLSGNVLYLSREGVGANQANVLQHRLTPAPAVTTYIYTGTPDIDKSYGLQIAPDSSIYHLYQATAGGDFLLGKISNVDSLVGNASFRHEIGLFKTRNMLGRQFPQFLPRFRENYTLDFTPKTDICLNSEVTFHPTLTNNATGERVPIDKARWNFTEGRSTSIVPRFTFRNAATNSVTLTAEAGGVTYRTSPTPTPIAIRNYRLQLTLVSDTTLCKEEFAAPRGNGTGSVTAQVQGGTPASIKWFGPDGDTGQTSLTLRPAKPGYYYIVVSDGTCSSYAVVNIKEYGFSEQRANIWYFGQNAGIDFNDPIKPLNDSKMNTPEGCSAISDSNGKIIFYTDGVSVYNKKHEQITNNIGGDQGASQSALIVTFTNDKSKYYIFTNKEIYNNDNKYELKYSIFDLKLNNGLGGMASENNLLMSPSTERIAATDNWLLAHEYGNNTFRAYPIATTGLGSPVYSNVGSTHPSTSSQLGQGYMKFNSGSTKVAVALGNKVELFDFDNRTGILSEPISLDFKGNAGNAYGVEFSPNGNVLFATVINGNNTKIFRWEVNNTNLATAKTPESHIKASFNEVANVIGQQLGAIQNGPNGTMYIARNDQIALATITSPSARMYDHNARRFVWNDVGFNAVGFNLSAGTQSKLGLPSFVQNIGDGFGSPTIQVANGCVNDPLNFRATGTDPIDEYRWTITNSTNNIVARDNQQNPTFTLTNPGTYTATLFVFNRCQNSPNATLTATFQIFEGPNITVGTINKPSSCIGKDGSFSFTTTSSGNISYSINDPANSTGTISNTTGAVTISNLAAGSYTVTLTDNTTSCPSIETVTISDPVPYTLSGSGLVDCSGKGGTLKVNFDNANAQNPSINYALINPINNTVLRTGNDKAVTGGNTFTINDVDEGSYIVKVTDGDCDSFSPVLKVSKPASFTLTGPRFVDACGGTQAEAKFTTNAPQIRFGVAGGAQQTRDLAGAKEVTLTFSVAGTYTVTALDIKNPPQPCPITKILNITYTQPSPNPLGSNYVLCTDPENTDPKTKSVKLDAGANFQKATWLDDNGNALVSGSDYKITGKTIEVLKSGNITAKLENAFGCITEAKISIVEDCKPRIVIPNAFRPSSKILKNQTLSIYSLFLKKDQFNIFIFNRWGEMVFHSDKVDFKWNGGFNNKASEPLPLGNYAYIVKYVDKNNTEKGVQEQRGGVLLIR